MMDNELRMIRYEIAFDASLIVAVISVIAGIAYVRAEMLVPAVTVTLFLLAAMVQMITAFVGLRKDA